MPVHFYPKCPFGEECSEGGKCLARCTTRNKAEQKIVSHLVGSPFHQWDEDAARQEAQGADISEWDADLEDPDTEPQVWAPRTASPPPERPGSKRRKVERELPPLMFTNQGQASGSARGAAVVPSAAVGGNQQVAAFLQNQIKTAFTMVKARLIHKKRLHLSCSLHAHEICSTHARSMS